MIICLLFNIDWIVSQSVNSVVPSSLPLMTCMSEDK